VAFGMYWVPICWPIKHRLQPASCCKVYGNIIFTREIFLDILLRHLLNGYLSRHYTRDLTWVLWPPVTDLPRGLKRETPCTRGTSNTDRSTCKNYSCRRCDWPMRLCWSCRTTWSNTCTSWTGEFSSGSLKPKNNNTTTVIKKDTSKYCKMRSNMARGTPNGVLTN